MAFYSNLISDSVLIGDTINLLKFHGGALSANIVADEVLGVSKIDAAFAVSLIADLIDEDPRLLIRENSIVELVTPNFETRKLHETEFVVFDTETTGTKPPFARMTEIGAYRVRNGEIVDEFQTLLNPEKTIPPFISSLTGITNQMVSRAPFFAEVAPDLLKFIGDSILVAHNAPFDITFLNYEIGRVYRERKLINAHLCTVRLARKLLPNLKNHRLHTVAEHFSIPIYNRHRAAGDALATAHIFVQFLKHLRARGVSDVASIKTLKP
ncbi:MAG: exonuclease domain-containing protein [Pyrinomonadaceae bacterium]